MPDELGTDENICVIVPAYIEKPLIRDTVELLLDGLSASFELIVAFNGCTDGSEHELDDFNDRRLRTIGLAVPNKAIAIRHAEIVASKYPRFYVDADVKIRGSALMKIARAMRQRELELASPRLALDLSNSSLPARAAAKTWMRLPHGSNEAFQAVIGVSKAGRNRWEEMPDFIADDTFIVSRFPLDKRAIVHDVEAVVRLPTRLWPFIKVRMRVEEGHRQLMAQNIQIPHAPGQHRALLSAALRPSSSCGAMIYGSAVLIAKLVVKLRVNRTKSWHQDRTVRRDG
jgi:glycosyltransferase involved in cell wall biosynthesis